MNREPGYYWVKCTDESIVGIAHWDGDAWALMANNHWDDSNFYDINEKRIQIPNENSPGGLNIVDTTTGSTITKP